MPKRSKTLQLGAALLCLAVAPAQAAYPERPITYVVPWGAGGSADTGVRTWKPYLEACLGNGAVVTVVNRPGAGGYVGFTEIANSEPDGYTLGSVHMPNMPSGAITGDASYKLDDFTFLGNLYSSNGALSVRRDNPKVKSLKDLVDEAKRTGAPIRIGIGSIGSDDYLTALRFAKMADVKVEFIPFNDTASTRNALLGGHVELISISAAETVPFKDQFLTLAVAADERYGPLPDAPTFKEQGYDLIGGSSHIIGAPEGIPDEAKEKLASCFQSIGQDPKFQADAKERSLLVNVMSSDKATEFMETESATLQQLWQSSPWK